MPGHIAGAWLVTRTIVNKIDPTSATERKRLLILGTVAGSVPDWDYLWYAIKKRGFAYDSDFQHHTWISHTFPFYWLPSLLVWVVGYLRGQRELQRKSFVFAAAASTHLLQDTIGAGDGIMLLYPFKKKMYAVAPSGLHGNEWDVHYRSSKIYRVEQLLVLTAVVSFILDLFGKGE